MYKKNKYKGLKEEEVLAEVKKTGFIPVVIHNSAGYEYFPHQHAETKLLVILKGSMVVSVDNIEYECSKGDEIVIPGNKVHSAVVGKKGCRFYWSEKIV